MKRIGVGVAGLAVLAAALGCSDGQGQVASLGDAAPRPVVEVKIESVRLGSIPEVLRATGSTQALRRENVGSPVDGKVTTLRVLEGDRVGRGDVLAEVETKESVAARTGAQLLLARAHTDDALRRAEADLERAQYDATTLEIHAPFDGVVQARAVNEGEFVSAGGTLVTLLDLSSLCFVARLPVRDLPRVAVGQEASVGFETSPGRRYPCRVDNLRSQIDPVAQMAEVRLRFRDSIADLRADMFGDAEIVLKRHSAALLVPDGAVLRDDETGQHTVVEAVGDSLGVVRTVEIGVETPDTVEIRGAELRPGMHIVVEGQYGLPDSTRIRVAVP